MISPCVLKNQGRESAAGDGGAEECQGFRAKILAPVGGGVEAALEFIEVRSKPVARAVDLPLYLLDCRTHATFSLIVWTVRSGVGCNSLSRRIPMVSNPMADSVSTPATTKVAAHIGQRSPRAKAAVQRMKTTAKIPLTAPAPSHANEETAFEASSRTSVLARAISARMISWTLRTMS